MNNIKHLRENSEMTQDELSRLVGVDRVTIANWESGKTEPKLSQAIKIANAFGVNLDALWVEK